MEKLFTLEEVAAQMHQDVEQLRKYVITGNYDWFECNGVICFSTLRMKVILQEPIKVSDIFGSLKKVPK